MEGGVCKGGEDLFGGGSVVVVGGAVVGHYQEKHVRVTCHFLSPLTTSLVASPYEILFFCVCFSFLFKESWQLRKGVSDFGEEVDYDEELYVASNMVIWSKGSKSEASAAYKAFSVDSPVLQVHSLDALLCLQTVP